MEMDEASESTPLYVVVPRALVLSDAQVADLIDGAMAEPLSDGWRIYNSDKVRRVLKGKI